MNTKELFKPSVADHMAKRKAGLLYPAFQFAAQAEKAMTTDHTGRVLALFDAQYRICAEAMNYFIQNPDPELYDLASDLYLALGRYLDIRNLDEDRQRWGNALIEATPISIPDEIVEKTNHVVLDDGSPRYLDEETLQTMSADDISTWANHVNDRGYLLWQVGNRDAALIFYGYALELFKRINHQYGMLGTLFNISSLYDSEGVTEQAIDWGKKGHDLAIKFGDVKLLAEAKHHLASVMRQDQIEPSVCQLYEQAITCFQQAEDYQGVMDAQFDYALYCLRGGAVDKALRLAQEVATIHQDFIGQPFNLVLAWIQDIETMLDEIDKST